MSFNSTPFQRLVFHAILGLLLMVCYPLQELFAGNQNVYFLWGMAQAGVGSLALDPLLTQTDPFPLFSLLVFGVMKFLHPWVFHLLYWLMNCMYCYALFGIADRVFDIYGRSTKTALLAALFLLMHSGAIWAGLFRVMFGIDLSWVWDSGMTEQGVLRGYLQPSTVGVFLLMSVLHFLKEQPKGVFLSLAMAAIIHPNYMFLGTLMGIIYLVMFIVEERLDTAQAIIWAGVSVLIVMPQLIYVATFFVPRSAEETAIMQDAVIRTQDGNIHLSPAMWLNAKTFLQVTVVGIAIWLFRKEAIGKLILAMLVVFLALSAATFITLNHTLLSLTPWRISVVLVPLCSMLLTARVFLNVRQVELRRRTLSVLMLGGVLLASFAFYRVFGISDEDFISAWRIKSLSLVVLAAALPLLPLGWLRKPVVTVVVSVGIISGAVASGLMEMVMEHRFRMDRPEQASITFLKEHARPDDMIMVPPSLTTLRINAGVAVVADNNLVHGLKLPELLERQDLARAFFTDSITPASVIALKDSFDCTALLLPIQKGIPTDLPVQEVYRDAYYRLVRLRINPRQNRSPLHPSQ
ncbi:MAG: hypothetical protein K9J06_03895 [Flavobacteriales bacterium]|nr:hypothetical protein [Flavobacteriales bacterium]